MFDALFSRLHLAKILLGLSGAGSVFVFALSSAAQTLPTVNLEQLERTLQREGSAYEQQLEEERRKARERRRNAGQIDMPPDPLSVPEGGPCFEIDRVQMSGFEALGQMPNSDASLIGKCSTLADIVRSLNAINSYYKNRGYITTRAYLPKQNISNGELSITVIPGTIEGYVYADGRQADARLVVAFRGQRGDLLNLRDLEQGLEVLNGPRSSKASFKLIPGENPGGSFVQITLDEKLPINGSLAIDNSGFDNTGANKVSANLGFDNILNLNDQLSVSVSGTPFDDRSLKYSENISGRFSLPYEYWLFTLEGGASRYFLWAFGNEPELSG